MRHRDLAFLVALLPATLVCWSCEGVGTSLVYDGVIPDEPQGMDSCLLNRECNTEELVEDEERIYVTEPVELDGCQTSEPSASSATACADLRWPQNELTSRIEMSGFTLTQSNLLIETTTPFEVVLDGAVLNDVWIALRGPVTLRVLSQSQLIRVRIHLAESQGEPRVFFEDSDVQSFVVTGPEDMRVGSVSLSRSRLVHSLLRSREVDIHSVVQRHVVVDAESLTATDLIDTSGRFAVTEALIVGSFLASARLTRCGQATIIATTMVHNVLGPCSDGPLRLYAVNMLEGFIDGPIEADESDLSLMRVGARAATSLVAWNSAFGSIHFCERTGDIRLGDKSSLSCSRCDNRKASKVTCTMPDDFTELFNNECEPLEEERTCEGNLPLRARPR